MKRRARRVIHGPVRRPWERRRRWLKWGLPGLLGLLVIVACVLYIAYPRIAAWAIRDKVTGRLEARLGRSVGIGAIDVNRDGKAVLSNLTIAGPGDDGAPLVRIDKITVHYDFWDSVTGRVRVHDVAIDGLHVAAVRGADGGDNFADLLSRLRGRSSGAGGGGRGGSSRLMPKTMSVASGDLSLRDESGGVTLRAGGLLASAERHADVRLVLSDVTAETTVGPAAGLGEVVVTGSMDDLRSSAKIELHGGKASLWPGMSLTGIDGTISEGDRKGRLAINVSGGYGGVEGTLWTAAGWVDPEAQTGTIDVDADRFTFDRLAPVLESSAVKDYQHTSMDARFRIDVRKTQVSVDGNFHLSGLTVFHPMLASQPVRDLSAQGPIQLVYERHDRRLELTKASVDARGVHYDVTGFAELPGGWKEDGTRRRAWHVGAHVVVPPIKCQKMFDGIPAELMPYEQGAKLKGTFEADVTTDIDFADLDATQLSSNLSRSIRRCKVTKMSEDADAARLQVSFLHVVEVGVNDWLTFMVGPENPDFVPIWDVSPFLIKSLTTTEDGRFYKHHGFINSEFKSALIKDLKAGYFRYGASSISMQMVKNVMLYREKTLSRKLQELFLTWYVETQLSKDRILEIYLNAIEFGPGIYGIGAAARHYFGKEARDINPVEAAFFSSILPNPKKRYKQYCSDKLWTATEHKIQRILALMHKRERITDDEYAVAQATPLVFYHGEDFDQRKCYALVKDSLENARPTDPMADQDQDDDE